MMICSRVSKRRRSLSDQDEGKRGGFETCSRGEPDVR